MTLPVVATGSHFGRDGTVRIWHTITWDLLDVFWGYDQGVDKVIFDFTGELMATRDKKDQEKEFSTYGCTSAQYLNEFANRYIAKLDQIGRGL